MTTEFELNRNEIIRGAYETCRVGIDGEELTAEQMQKGARMLNTVIKYWQAQGFHLWKLGEGWLFPKIGQAVYKLGNGGDMAMMNANQNVVMFPAYAGYNSLVLDSNRIMPEVGDIITVNTGSNTVFVSTVTAINDNAVTLADILPHCVFCNTKVYFGKALNRPSKILQARRYIVGGSEIEMVYLENAEYFKLPQKEQQGTPTSWTYVPTLGLGTFYLWNTPALNNIIVKFTFEQAFDITENSSDIPDIAPEWILPLQLELAYQLSDYCGLDLNERGWLKSKAFDAVNEARSFDQEIGGFQITPAYRG